jgi:replicative DNA helicase
MQLIDHQVALASEKVVLQSLLLDNELFCFAERLRPEDFQNSYHRMMFDAISKRIKSGQQVDEIILADHFHGNGVSSYIADLNAVATKKLEPHVDEIARASQRRQIVKVLGECVDQANDLSEDNASVLEVSYERLMKFAEHTQASKSLRFSEFSDAFYNKTMKVALGQSSTNALTTGLVDLDDLTGGLFPGEFVVVGGWTNEGKTPFVTQIIAANCSQCVPCLLFSQEMTKNAVLSRCIPAATRGQITGWKLRNPKRMNSTDHAAFMESKAVLDAWPVWVNDASSIDVGEFTSHATMMIRKHGIKLVAVDYIQLMQARGDSRAQKVSACSAALRELAKNNNVVVIGVSQFGRPSEKSKRRPVLFDLKESGDVENDAHLALLVYRPLDKSKKFTMKDEIIVAKQREGALGSAAVVFDQKQLIFLPRVSDGVETEEPPDGW